MENEDLDRFNAKMETQNIRIINETTGKAMMFNAVDATITIYLPFSLHTMPEMTIEFWAMMPPPYDKNDAAQKSWLFNLTNPAWLGLDYFGITDNDGSGKRRLIGHVLENHPMTMSLGIDTSVEINNISGGWHHYAFIWNLNGVDCIETKEKRVVFSFDGKIVTPDIDDYPIDGFKILDNTESGTYLLFRDHNFDSARPVAIRDLKIWNFSKIPTTSSSQ